MKILYLLFGLVLLISIVSAEQESLGIFEEGDCMNILQTCSNCTYVNLTQIYITGSNPYIYTIGINMQKKGSNYNYSFCNTSIIGTYIITTCGNPDGELICVDFTAIVTTTGQVVGLPNIILVVVFLVSSVVTLLIGNSFDKSKWLVRTSFYFISLLLLVLALSSASIIASESLNLSLLSNSGMLIIISIVSFFALYLFIMWSIETFKSVKQKEGVRWNY